MRITLTLWLINIKTQENPKENQFSITLAIFFTIVATMYLVHGIIMFTGINDSTNESRTERRKEQKKQEKKKRTRANAYTRVVPLNHYIAITYYIAYIIIYERSSETTNEATDTLLSNRFSQPDNHGNNSQECNTCQIKGFVRKKRGIGRRYNILSDGQQKV